MRLTVIFLALLSSAACATSHPVCEAPDASSPDAPRAPCPPPLVDEGDACVGWRALPSPPCPVVALVRAGDALAIRCDPDLVFALGPSSTWEPHESAGTTPIAPADAPALPIWFLPIVAVLPDGTRIATHGDPYAAPAAARTDVLGGWRETVPPPSAFLAFGAALSEHEALFVGGDAFVYRFERR